MASTGSTCSPARPHRAGQTEESIRVDGLDRTYLLYVPESYDPTRPSALVMNFHGYGSSAIQQMSYADFRPLADTFAFLVVAPDGQGNPPHFNLRPGQGSEADDVAFAIAVVDAVVRTMCVDEERVYATGMSNGGALSSILACRASDTFAAVGPVAAIVGPISCEGAQPVPIAAFMGADDPVVPFEGGTVSCCGNPTIGSTPEAMAAWAAHNGCQPEPVIESKSPEVELRRWIGCREAAATELYVIKGGGHTWPGATGGRGRLGATTDDIDATSTLWEFFIGHPRQ